MKNKLSISLIIGLMLLPLPSLANITRYVSDNLQITVRSGQGSQFSIRKMLTSGSKVNVLKTSSAGYSKVRTSSGEEGWVLSKYLSNTPSANERLATCQQNIANDQLQLTAVKDQINTLQTQLKNSSTGHTNASNKIQELSTALYELRRTAASSIKISDDNRQLKEKLRQTDMNNQALKIENEALKNSNNRHWLLVGAIMLFAGFFIGSLLSIFRSKKKNTWDNRL